MKVMNLAVVGCINIILGMFVTLKHFLFVKRFTTQYPEETLTYAANFRGEHRLKRDELGFPKCVACFMCETACPAHCIHIVAAPYEEWSLKDKFPANPGREKVPEVFNIDMLKCIYCGMCEEACPCDAIELTKMHYIPAVSREEKLYDINKLLSR